MTDQPGGGYTYSIGSDGPEHGVAQIQSEVFLELHKRQEFLQGTLHRFCTRIDRVWCVFPPRGFLGSGTAYRANDGQVRFLPGFSLLGRSSLAHPLRSGLGDDHAAQESTGKRKD
jgi:hypothetical protein